MNQAEFYVDKLLITPFQQQLSKEGSMFWRTAKLMNFAPVLSRQSDARG